MKKISFVIVAMLLLAVKPSLSQQATSCATAVNQLQGYAAQVNQIYNAEYWTIIPNQRCPAFDAWGRPYNPVLVQNCRLQFLSSLNLWYSQQCNYVNSWYVQIVNGCANKQSSRISKPAPGKVSGPDHVENIDEDNIEDLTAGVDEDKAVKITIPKTPAGFKPRN